MDKQNKLFAWQESKGGLTFITLFNFLIAYVFISLAFNTGSLIDYFIAFAFFALGVGQGVKLIRKLKSRG